MADISQEGRDVLAFLATESATVVADGEKWRELRLEDGSVLRSASELLTALSDNGLVELEVRGGDVTLMGVGGGRRTIARVTDAGRATLAAPRSVTIAGAVARASAAALAGEVRLTSSLDVTVIRWFERIPDVCPIALQRPGTRDSAIHELSSIRDQLHGLLDSETDLRKAERQAISDLAIGGVELAIAALSAGEEIATRWERSKRAFLLALDRLRNVSGWLVAAAANTDGLLGLVNRARTLIEGLLGL